MGGRERERACVRVCVRAHSLGFREIKKEKENESYIHRKEINLCLIEAIDSDCLSVGRSQKVKK